MAVFLYRCPATGYNVQGFVADEGGDEQNHACAITCTACARLHLVNPKTGKVIGGDDE